MPVNPSIPLQIQGPQIGQSMAAGTRFRQQNQLFDIALEDRAANKPLVESQRRNAIDMEAVKAEVIGAERLGQFVESGDLAGALADRQQELQRARSAGMPTQSLEASIAAITEAQQSGDLTNLVRGIQARRQVGERLGIIGTGATQAKPSALVEQYQLAKSEGYGGSYLDFVKEQSRRQVGAQYGAPTDVPGVGIMQPSRTEGAAGNVVISPEANVSAASAARAGAEAEAKAEVAATAEQQKELVANQRTLEVWNVAKQGLTKALAGTRTGPEQALVPAVTSGQQTADGAVAAVAPVLKQLFRTAGEGVFTDRDQELLLDMVPTREDHPETRVAKIEMIDAIIQAKLSASVPGQGASAPSGGVVIRYDAQGNRLQ